VSDAVSGYKAIRWLKGFVGDMVASMPGLIAMMKRVQEKNIVKARMVLGLTSTKPVCLKKLVDGLLIYVQKWSTRACVGQSRSFLACSAT